MATKTELHRLVDELPETEVTAAKRFLEYLRDIHGDPVLQSLANAPEDDEPLTPEDTAAIEQGKADYRRGAVISDEELRREFGL